MARHALVSFLLILRRAETTLVTRKRYNFLLRLVDAADSRRGINNPWGETVAG